MSEGAGRVHEKILAFRRKYYFNLFIRGAILTLSILLGYLLLASLLEHSLWLSAGMRFSLLLMFFSIAGFCLYRFLTQPIKFWVIKKGMDDQQTARLIGDKIPTVQDHLVNLLQLIQSDKSSALTFASIQQKSATFDQLVFADAIDFRENKQYLKFLAVPVVLVLVILVFNQQIITGSARRIVQFNREFSPEAPFTFSVTNSALTAFYNEDFLLEVALDGNAVPENAFIVSDKQRLKLERVSNGRFRYLFDHIRNPISFQIEAAGFYSEPFKIEIVTRPELSQFHVELEYPRYIQRKNEKISNAGNLEIPEGTTVRWNLTTLHTNGASISFASDSIARNFERQEQNEFLFTKKFKDADQYEIRLTNGPNQNKDRISYAVSIIKDQHPEITVNNFKDSVLYQRVLLGGAIGDDYGLTDLQLHYQIKDENQKIVQKKSIRIPIAKQQLQQNFFYSWAIDSLALDPGNSLEYYVEVWDNDGVNGRKSTRSALYNFLIPDQQSLVAEISKSQEKTESTIDESVNKASDLQEQIEQAQQKLKGKQSLDWQDKKMLEDILQQKKSLDQVVENIQKENDLLEQKKDAFTEQNERIKEKAEQLQKLMNELLDEETKKLFEELQRMLQEKSDVNEMQKLLNKLNQNSRNLEKDLERSLELFKELQYEFKFDQGVQDLKKMVEEQKKINEQTNQLERQTKDKKQNKSGQNQENKNESSDPQSDANELAEEQEKLQEEMKKFSEQMKELEKLGDELDKKEDLPGEQESQQVQDEQKESEEMLKQNNPSKAKQPQQNAVKKMEEMQQKMEEMQSSMMMEMDMQNMESLRQILHGLVKLSFDQEGLMKEFNELQSNDPRFNALAQQQLKLRDDSKVLEDSLLALAKKDPMLGSFVTKEIGELNNHMDRAIDYNKERRRAQAGNEMQLSMTSINNLALMLDDHFDMMMQMMANAKPSGKKSKKKGDQPSLGQLQQQLNQRIEQLKNSGKSGRQLSEELAEMAAEQERIRRALQEMQEKMQKEGKSPGGDLPGKMEQTEMDLVNKQITEQMIRRQKEILTRLLETEKSMREQDMEEERKGETAKDYEKEIPKAFEDYLRLKEKEVELLKTVPPKLYPYYKKEVSEYFKRMGN